MARTVNHLNKAVTQSKALITTLENLLAQVKNDDVKGKAPKKVKKKMPKDKKEKY